MKKKKTTVHTEAYAEYFIVYTILSWLLTFELSLADK